MGQVKLFLTDKSKHDGAVIRISVDHGSTLGRTRRAHLCISNRVSQIEKVDVGKYNPTKKISRPQPRANAELIKFYFQIKLPKGLTTEIKAPPH